SASFRSGRSREAKRRTGCLGWMVAAWRLRRLELRREADAFGGANTGTSEGGREFDRDRCLSDDELLILHSSHRCNALPHTRSVLLWPRFAAVLADIAFFDPLSPRNRMVWRMMSP